MRRCSISGRLLGVVSAVSSSSVPRPSCRPAGRRSGDASAPAAVNTPGALAGQNRCSEAGIAAGPTPNDVEPLVPLRSARSTPKSPCSSATFSWSCHRGLRAPASLKRLLRTSRLLRLRASPGSSGPGFVEASASTPSTTTTAWTSPGSSGPGFVEARYASSAKHWRSLSPGSSGPGFVEAGRRSPPTPYPPRSPGSSGPGFVEAAPHRVSMRSCPRRHRGLRAPASLKQPPLRVGHGLVVLVTGVFGPRLR